MGSDKLKKIPLFIALVICTCLVFIIPKVAKAGGSNESKSKYVREKASYDNEETVPDYSLVVIEDEMVPLSATDRDYSGYVMRAFFVVLVAVLIIMYILWFRGHKRRIIMLRGMSENAEMEAFNERISFLHPIKAMRYENELENCVASESTKSV